MGVIFSQHNLEQVRAASDIVEIIGATLPLKRAGANFVTLCPFHKEKTASFNVNPHRQIFHCFGCHKGGDVFRWIQEYENLTFPEAVRRLAERARIPLEVDKSPENQQARSVKDSLLQIHEQITQRWHSSLKNEAGAEIARDYLAKRGVTTEAIEVFRLGYAPDMWDDTVNWGKSKNYDAGLLEKAGLVVPREGDGHYDRFRGRLMFPICDEQGRVIAFSGRILTDEKTAKYVNSPETPIFTKGRVFYGLDKTKRAILDAGFAIICEGQLDLIACYMAGVKNIVAPQGTAFTGDHARILKRYVDEVVLCFDSDTAGQSAAARVQESLIASGMAIRVVTIPSPHDPDSFIKERGAQAFQVLISGASEFFEFYLEHLCALHDPATDKGQIAVVQAMAEIVNKAASPIITDKYAQKTAMKLATYSQVPIAAEAVRAEFKKGSRAPGKAEPKTTTALEEVAMPSEREFWLLKYLFASDEAAEWAKAQVDLAWIHHPSVKQILATRFSPEWRSVPAMIDETEDAALRNLLTAAVAADIDNADLLKKTRDTALLIRNDHLDRELQKLSAHLNQPELTQGDVVNTLQLQAQLRKLKQQPLA
jgi:DNA primase